MLDVVAQRDKLDQILAFLGSPPGPGGAVVIMHSHSGSLPPATPEVFMSSGGGAQLQPAAFSALVEAAATAADRPPSQSRCNKEGELHSGCSKGGAGSSSCSDHCPVCSKERHVPGAMSPAPPPWTPA